MNNNILQHLTIRLGIPLLIFFLIWQIADPNHGSLENLLQFLLITTFIAFVIVSLTVNETFRFHKNKKKVLRNVNISLLVLYIPIFVFMVLASYGLATF
ncbi:hypothetical protein SAMN06265346_107206 [Flavobacterium hercynium]|uniref:Uncharacterized protein n=1 Tax=Flavobacterium hercynium TaxID=387094 RepID=A0A226HMS8_9FLAO|nr:hypothetical protein B0A66_02555 [Flavobacterium hercynium]SMP22851.1 hypothetical protein SAMN06265346_107206 [Flavobacterium hercynium]